MVNVLTRTHCRPKAFAACRKSVLSQLGVRVNHLVINDSEDDYPTGDVVVKINGFTPVVVSPKLRRFGTLDPNRYIPMLFPLIKEGWVMVLDDDDMFCHDAALADVLGQFPSEDTIYVGRTRGSWPGTSTAVIPRRNKDWGKKLTRGNVCSCSYLFHSKYLHEAKWRYRRCGDFAAVSSLQNAIPYIEWRDIDFTQLQGAPGHALGKVES